MSLSFSKIWPSVVMVLVNIVTVFNDVIVQFLQQHPNLGLGMAGVVTILANMTKGVKVEQEPKE